MATTPCLPKSLMVMDTLSSIQNNSSSTQPAHQENINGSETKQNHIDLVHVLPTPCLPNPLMATLSSIQNNSSIGHQENNMNGSETKQNYIDLLHVLPKERGWLSEHIHKYQGFWYSTAVLKGLVILQQHFQPLPNDILLVTYPKSGTTWLKALLFTLTNRDIINHPSNPLLKSNPHELVTYLETYACMNPTNPRPTTSSLMHTHIPFSSLPNAVMESDCKIIYVIRDPKDTLVSCWHFLNKLRPKELPPITLKEAFEQFSKGHSPYGPYWDHVEGYCKAKLEFPNKVFFLRYEDLKKEPCLHVKRLAKFIGHGFSLEEEKEGIVSKVVDFCSFEKLSGLEVNKTGTHLGAPLSKPIQNNVFFRQGKVGDSMSYLSKEMMNLLDQISEERFKEFNLESFDYMCPLFGHDLGSNGSVSTSKIPQIEDHTQPTRLHSLADYDETVLV